MTSAPRSASNWVAHGPARMRLRSRTRSPVRHAVMGALAQNGSAGGQIILSSIMSVANGKLPELVAAYRRNYPGVELYVRDGVHGTVIEDVRSGAADFGITYLDDLPDPFVSTRVGSEQFTVVLPKNHELARKKSLSLSDLKDAPLVSFPSDSRTRRVIDGA